VAALHGAVLHGIEHLQAGHDFTGGKDANLELAFAAFGHAAREDFCGAVQGVEAFRKTRGEPPLDGRLRAHDRRCGHRACGKAQPCLLQE